MRGHGARNLAASGASFAIAPRSAAKTRSIFFVRLGNPGMLQPCPVAQTGDRTATGAGPSAESSPATSASDMQRSMASTGRNLVQGTGDCSIAIPQPLEH